RERREQRAAIAIVKPEQWIESDAAIALRDRQDTRIFLVPSQDVRRPAPGQRTDRAAHGAAERQFGGIRMLGDAAGASRGSRCESSKIVLPPPPGAVDREGAKRPA